MSKVRDKLSVEGELVDEETIIAKNEQPTPTESKAKLSKNPYSKFESICQISKNLGINYGEELNEDMLKTYPRPQRILIKTLKRLFNSDIEKSVILFSRLLKKGIIMVFKLLQCKYIQNEDYEIYDIREDLLSDMILSEKEFFARFDTSNNLGNESDFDIKQPRILEKYLSEFIIEVFCFAEEFKEAWFKFYTN